MTNLRWRDRHGVVHLLDGFDYRWCDETPSRPLERNSNALVTCLRCLGNWVNYNRERSA